jgi:hypothetical protein
VGAVVIGAKLGFDGVEVLDALTGCERADGLSSGCDTAGEDDGKENGSEWTAHR